MKIISTSYIKTGKFEDPGEWLKRIGFYTGILEELSRQHEVISIERINYQGLYREKAVQYYFVRLKNRIVYFPWHMHQYIKKQKPDIVLVHGFVFPLQILQLRWTLGKSAKIIVQNHAEKPSRGVMSFFQRLADRFINAYLFTSAEMGQEWVEKGIIGTSQKIVEVMEVSSSFNLIDNINASRAISGTPLFLWVGRLNSNKDPLTVVKAFISFLDFQPSAKLNMIYQTDELLEEVKNLISTNDKARKAIQLIGYIPHHQLLAWYEGADFFISGSHYEGGGVAVCEAMGCGCIPLLTNILSFRKMTGPGKCGLLYEPGNDKSLLECLLQTREMNSERERHKVLNQFKEELSFEAIAGKINGLIASWALH